MYTFQDFKKDTASAGVAAAVARAISYHITSDMYKVAIDADNYDAQKNTTINEYAKMLYTSDGRRIIDKTASNSRLCSNFFRRLNTQRVTYSLGNGVQFATDGLKEKLGHNFDTKLKNAAYCACIHGVSFLFWNFDHMHVFKFTEFVPLLDEETGALMAGVRFWRVAPEKPSQAVLYELDGYTVFTGASGYTDFRTKEEKRAYIQTLAKAPADRDADVIGEANYNGLPIVPLYGSRLKQSTLVGMKAQIDAYDLIRSGFANDLNDCSEIYWIIGGAGGMMESDLAEFRQRLKLDHIASIPDVDDVSVTPYTQEVPYNSRQAFLNDLRAGIYEDFGGLDVHTVAAGATNDHIDAAYQPLDENADDFEYEVIEAVQAMLKLLGVDDTPVFKRNRISNERETAETVLLAANYLDDETVLQLLPFVSPDMIASIMEKKDVEEAARITQEPAAEE